MILLTIDANAATMNYSGGKITGTLVIGTGWGGFNFGGGQITSNISIAESVTGANYTGGLIDGTLGYIGGILDLPPVVNTVNLLPATPQVNDTLYCNVTATDSEGATMTLFREWYNITGTQTEVTSFRNDQTVNSSDITFAERYFCQAKAFDGTQNSTNWVLSSNISINDTITPIISGASSAATATQNDNVNFDIDCSDGGSRVQSVRIELVDPNAQVNNATASVVTGNTYRRTVSLNVVGNWTFQSVTCLDWANQTTLNSTINRVTVVSTSGGGGDGGGGGGGGGGSPSYSQTFVPKVTFVTGQVVTSPAGNWTVETASEKLDYELIMTRNDVIKDRAPILITNTGNTILDFTISCSSLGSTDTNISNVCDYVDIDIKNFTLVPEQKQIIDVSFTSNNFPNGALYTFEILNTDNSATTQAVRYTININYFYGTIAKILRNVLTFFGLITFIISILIGTAVYYLGRKQIEVRRVLISIVSGLLTYSLILLYVG